MKKVGLLIKDLFSSRIEKDIKKASAFFFLQYSGINGLAMNNLRKNLKKSNARLFITKNIVVKRLLEKMDKNDLIKFIDGPTAFVFANEDIVSVSKVLVDFSKENMNLKLQGGFFQEKELDKSTITDIARLPSKDVLIAQAVFGIKAPLNNLVFVLSGMLKKVLIVLDQIKQNKERSK
ncbi:MAG: 50S ribosomal protein L10 [Candidatus Gygaella obscura]|nr:50S ribosomal protein L10 [Candidatus Gygaella obscura]